MGPIAAIGIVKGKPFPPDARMKKILTDAAAWPTPLRAPCSWSSGGGVVLLPGFGVGELAVRRRLRVRDADPGNDP